MPKAERIGLTSRQVRNFKDDGFVRIVNAFSTNLAKMCRDERWADIGLSPDEPKKWTRPVIRVGWKASHPFVDAANTLALHKAYDQLVGKGRWLAPAAMGIFRSAFPRRNLQVTMVGTWT